MGHPRKARTALPGCRNCALRHACGARCARWLQRRAGRRARVARGARAAAARRRAGRTRKLPVSMAAPTACAARGGAAEARAALGTGGMHAERRGARHQRHACRAARGTGATAPPAGGHSRAHGAAARAEAHAALSLSAEGGPSTLARWRNMCMYIGGNPAGHARSACMPRSLPEAAGGAGMRRGCVCVVAVHVSANAAAAEAAGYVACLGALAEHVHGSLSMCIAACQGGGRPACMHAPRAWSAAQSAPGM